jgi:hypothetical protein
VQLRYWRRGVDCQALRRLRCGAIGEEQQRSKWHHEAVTYSGEWGLLAQTALLVVDDDTASTPPRALSAPRKTHARSCTGYSDGLLGPFDQDDGSIVIGRCTLGECLGSNSNLLDNLCSRFLTEAPDDISDPLGLHLFAVRAVGLEDSV